LLPESIKPEASAALFGKAVESNPSINGESHRKARAAALPSR